MGNKGVIDNSYFKWFRNDSERIRENIIIELCCLLVEIHNKIIIN